MKNERRQEEQQKEGIIVERDGEGGRGRVSLRYCFEKMYILIAIIKSNLIITKQQIIVCKFQKC